MLEAIHKANILSDKVHLIPKFISDVEAASIALVLDLIKEHNGTVSRVFCIMHIFVQSSSNISRPKCLGTGMWLLFATVAASRR